MKAKEIMTHEVITVKQSATIEEIARVLVENDISGVPVVDDNGKMVGMVSEGDLLHKETNPRLPNFFNILGAIIYYNGVERYREDFSKLMASNAGEIMTRKVYSVKEDDDVETVAQAMITHNVKRVPVLRGTELVGIISRADMVKLLIG